MTLQTEFDFVLPKGFVDDNGIVQRAIRAVDRHVDVHIAADSVDDFLPA